MIALRIQQVIALSTADFVRSLRTQSLGALIGVWILHGCSSAKPVAADSKSSDDRTRYANNIVDTEKTSQKASIKQNQNTDPGKMINEDTLIDAYYKITGATLGTQACTGFASIKISSGLKKDQPLLYFPDGELDCGPLGKASLKPVLETFALSLDDENVEIRSHAIQLKKRKSLTFSPSLPYLPSFLASKASDLAKLNLQISHEVFDEKTQTKTTGISQLRMLGFGEELRSTTFKRTFHDVMRWEKLHSGFEGIDKVSAGIIDRYEWTVSLNPLAILSIKMRAPAKDLMDSFQNTKGVLSPQVEGLIKAMPKADGTGIIDQLIGKEFEDFTQSLRVELTAELVDQKNLSPSESESGSGTGSSAKAGGDQVEIGK